MPDEFAEIAIENPRHLLYRQQLTGRFTGTSRELGGGFRSTASFVHIRQVRTPVPRCASIYIPATYNRHNENTMRPHSNNLQYMETAYRFVRIGLVYIKPRGSPTVPHNSAPTFIFSKLLIRSPCDSEKTLSAICFRASYPRSVWQDVPTRSSKEITTLGNNRERRQPQEVSALGLCEAK